MDTHLVEVLGWCEVRLHVAIRDTVIHATVAETNGMTHKYKTVIISFIIHASDLVHGL